ncbi:hypothetical protein ACNFBT_11040 [Pseudomonas sp. NY15181]
MSAAKLKIRLIDHSGLAFGWLSLPASARVVDLQQLRSLGAARVEVIV